ncbi:ureidoglycolate lyase [Abditibacteriota bacterium]|nr:ureidoglycolate lyase [Abditibacteriota bacterium]
MPLYGRFLVEGEARFAEIELAAPSQFAGAIAHFLSGDLFTNPTRTGESAPVESLEILPPIVPPKLFAIGRNYAAHAREQNSEVPSEPLMWYKGSNSLLAHGGTVEVAYPDHRTDHEAELALVIGRRCKGVSEDDALDVIWGITCSQDISDRKIQRGESQWARAKGFDTYTPLGPFISTDFDLSQLKVQTILNGEVKQDGNTSDLVFSPANLIAFLSKDITLEAGDVILTGTPEGVGALSDGDDLETRIGDLVPLRNPVRFKR